MSFTDILKFKFKSPGTGIVLCNGRYRTFALINHSKTLRNLLVYKYPDPENDTLSTDDLDCAYSQIRDPYAMKLLFDLLAFVAKMEKPLRTASRSKTTSSGHRTIAKRKSEGDSTEWVLEAYDKLTSTSSELFNGVAATFFHASMNVYACALELQLDADKTMRIVPTTLRTRLLTDLCTTNPSAHDVAFAWRAFGESPHSGDTRLFRAVVARTVSYLCTTSPAALESNAVRPDDAYPPTPSTEAEPQEAEIKHAAALNADEQQPILSILRANSSLAAAFAAALFLREISAEANARMPPTHKNDALDALAGVLLTPGTWDEIMRTAKRICATAEARYSARSRSRRARSPASNLRLRMEGPKGRAKRQDPRR